MDCPKNCPHLKGSRSGPVSLLVAALWLTLGAALLVPGRAPAQTVFDAYRTFENSLSAAEQAAAVTTFDDPDRRAYRLTPGTRGGLALMNMDDATRAATFALLESALTDRGMAVVRGAIDREARLAKIEDSPDYRNPDKYYLALFGRSDAPRWALRFEGHHLSINLTFSGETLVSVTPFLLGANPRELPDQTPDPLAPFLANHENEPAFLSEFARLFRHEAPGTLLDGARVETSGFGLWRHPHMEVLSP
ncbi:MAG: DUF3500 domain-containing protein [Pseudomonadota bacterium]